MLQKLALLSLLLMPFGCIAQQDTSVQAPRLIGAEIPRYPPLARAARITGWLDVHVTVKQGKVVRTELVRAEANAGNSQAAKGGSPMLNEPTLSYIQTWRFGSSVNRSFIVKFTYKIDGPETDEPENPVIEIRPSLDVNITARPVRPSY